MCVMADTAVWISCPHFPAVTAVQVAFYMLESYMYMDSNKNFTDKAHLDLTKLVFTRTVHEAQRE